MIGNKIGKYKLIELIGSGGNANVYKAEDNKGNVYAVKILKVGKYPGFYKKYKRFKDEVKIVRMNQTTVTGIVPIIESFLPNNPLKNIPWYSMPIATPLTDVINKDSNFHEIMTCVEELSSTLVLLHGKGIVHRDIKPNNLYYYNGHWAFGDFGLVEYPRKTDLTARGESVGPKFTIAPEMKRDAKHSDGKAADIYSLAKTLWILLSGVSDGFEGQYSDNIERFNIANYQEKGFSVSLHDLLSKCTSNSPDERPNITTFNQVIKEWFLISEDFKRKNLIEWEYIFRKIIPNTTPETIRWTSVEDIVFILNHISKLDSLNHVFMPGGGGLDLTECTLSNETDFIELHFNYLIKKLKPKSLDLNTFPNMPHWNYFLLETEEIEGSGLYPKGENYYEDLLEISPGVYIEPYHQYYKEVSGVPIPSSAREIMLSLKGSYAIFAKGSTYNEISSTYDGRHNKMSSSEFHEYIKSMIRYEEWAEAHPDEAERNYQERMEREREKYENESKEFELRDIQLKSLWDSSLANVKMPTVLDTSITGEVYFTIEMKDQYFENNYYVSASNELILDPIDDFKRLVHGSTDPEELLKIYNFGSCVEYINQLKKSLLDFEGSEDIDMLLYFDINIHRVKKPTHQFTKEELMEFLKNANDKVYNRIAIQTDGTLDLITKDLDYLELKKYPYKGWEFYAFENSVGNKAQFKNFEEIYMDLLAGWCFHLEFNRRAYQSANDYYHDLSEVELLKKITIAIQQYAE